MDRSKGFNTISACLHNSCRARSKRRNSCSTGRVWWTLQLPRNRSTSLIRLSLGMTRMNCIEFIYTTAMLSWSKCACVAHDMWFWLGRVLGVAIDDRLTIIMIILLLLFIIIIYVCWPSSLGFWGSIELTQLLI